MIDRGNTMIENERIQELILKIESRGELSHCVFHAVGAYFIVKEGKLLAIPDTTDAGNSFEIFHGLATEQNNAIEEIIDSTSIEPDVFEGIRGLYDIDDDESMSDYYEAEENEDALKAIESVKEWLSKNDSAYKSVYEFACDLSLYGIPETEYGYFWDGDWISLYDNIEDTGEEYHLTEMVDEDGLIDILESINDYIL